MESPNAVKRALATMHDLVESVLVKDVHYGVIPGTHSKSLLKPGSEILFKAFQCQARHTASLLEMNRDERFVLIQVVCEAVHVTTGIVLAEGMGAATSEKWQKNTKVDFGWLYNSTLKIAEKRAEVDCALKLGAVSAHFTQDMEDYDGGVIDHETGESTAPKGGQDNILRMCPMHKVSWYDGKFGKQHKKPGGGFCDLKDILKSKLEQVCKASGVGAEDVNPICKEVYMQPWSKLNPVEQVSIIERISTMRQVEDAAQDAASDDHPEPQAEERPRDELDEIDF